MIKSDLNELTRITTEIKRMSASLKSLRATKRIIGERMTKFLSERDIEGGKVGDSIILLKEKTTRKTKSKKDLDTDLYPLFEKYDIRNPESFMKELNKMSKDNVVTNTIRVKKRKDVNL
jgi:hypothetical protein